MDTRIIIDRALDASIKRNTGIAAFAKEMKAAGIHVGVNGTCAVCDTAYPCDWQTEHQK
jgi:hypothetical protein